MDITYLLLTLAILVSAVLALNVKVHGWKRGLVLTFSMILTAVFLVVFAALAEPWGLLIIAAILLVVVIVFL